MSRFFSNPFLQDPMGTAKLNRPWLVCDLILFACTTLQNTAKLLNMLHNNEQHCKTLTNTSQHCTALLKCIELNFSYLQGAGCATSFKRRVRNIFRNT